MTEPRHNNFWLLLEVLAKRRGLILSLTILATLVSVGIASILPEWYKAEALIMPPKEDKVPMISLGGLSEGAAGFDLATISTSADVFVQILKSRTITDRIIDKFDLMKRYDAENYVEAFETLMDNSEIVKTTEGLLFVAVSDKEAKVAADLANAFVDELDRVSREVVSAQAREKRVFFTERLNQVNQQLANARKDLERFQLQYKAVDFDEQTRLAIEQAIKLKVTMAEIDIQVKLLEQNLRSDNAELVDLRNHRDIVKAELQKLETGNADSSFFSLPLASIPVLKSEYESFYSRVRVNEALSSLLMQQLEQARIQEGGSFTEFSVLQRAVPPEISYRPQRVLIVILTFILSLIISILLATVWEYFHKLQTKSPEDYDRAMMFFRAYLGWLPGMKRKG